MSMKTLLNVLTIFSLGTLTGCDYIEKASLIVTSRFFLG